MRATEAMQNRDKPRPRRAEDASDYEEEWAAPTPPEEYTIVHSKAVAVRAAPALDAKVLGARFPAERVMVREVIDGWAKLDASTKDKEMWVLVDGSAYGMGTLLERTAAANDVK